MGAGLEELGKLCRGLVGPPVLFTEELRTQPSGGDWMIMVAGTAVGIGFFLAGSIELLGAPAPRRVPYLGQFGGSKIEIQKIKYLGKIKYLKIKYPPPSVRPGQTLLGDSKRLLPAP